MVNYFASLAAGVWVVVTPHTMMQDVPSYRYQGVPGSVQPVEWRRSKPVSTCPVVEDGKVVGFRLSCESQK